MDKPQMTPMERAEKIYEWFDQPMSKKTLVDFIAAAIEEAQREGLRKGLNYGTHDAFDKGFRSAIEKAAKSVDVCQCEITLDYDGLEHILEECRKRIRAIPTGEK